MNKDPTLTRFVAAIICPMIQTLMDEGIAPGKVFQNVGLVDVVQGDAQMLEAAQGSPALGEFPVHRRHYVGDVGVLESLWTTQGLEPIDVDIVTWDLAR